MYLTRLRFRNVFLIFPSLCRAVVYGAQHLWRLCVYTASSSDSKRPAAERLGKDFVLLPENRGRLRSLSSEIRFGNPPLARALQCFSFRRRRISLPSENKCLCPDAFVFCLFVFSFFCPSKLYLLTFWNVV